MKSLRFLLIALLSAYSFGLQAQSSADNALIESYQLYDNARYVVRWNVEPDKILTTIGLLPRYQYFILYTQKNLLRNTSRPQVQFGFFKSSEEAFKFTQEHGSAFAGLNVVSVSAAEHRELFAEDTKMIWLSPPSQERTTQSTQALFREAKQAYIAENYRRALALYSVLALSSDQAVGVWGLELYGVTQERMGQREQAKQTYETLLARNPEGNWVNRVQQRLRALETAAEDGKQALRTSKYQNRNKDTYWRGFFGQSYDSLAQSTNFGDDREPLEVLTTYYDFSGGTSRWSGHELEARLSGYDMMDLQEDGDHARTRVKRLYLSYTHSDSGLNVVGGRQRDNKAGVFGYFDGASLEYPLFKSKLKLGAKVGVPVRFTDFYDALDHEFFSLYSEYQLNADWQVGAYLINQTLFGELDRAAYGGKVQFIGKKISSSLHLDYDYEFAELNIARYSGNFVLNEKSRINLALGMQRNPFISSTNIQIGQPYQNLQQYLRDETNRRFLMYYALQRTSMYQFGSATYHHKLDEKMDISVDVYHSSSTDLPVFIESDDGWITADVAYTDEYDYSSAGVSAVVQGLFAERDLATMSYRYGDTTFAKINTIKFSERFRWGKKVYIKPALGLKQSVRKADDASKVYMRGSLGLAYKPWRNVELRVDAGNEVIEDVENKHTINSNYIYAGYQLRF